MSQYNTKKIGRILLIQILFFAALSSCSKAPSGVRAQAKTQQNNLTPAASSQANQQAAAFNANYNIASVSVPRIEGAGVAVDLELTNPSGEFLPVTTYHEANNADSYGIYNDTQRGVQVRLDARCSNTSDCSKYILLVTVIKNNQMIYQTFAVSYKDDCKFSVASASANSGNFFRDLNSADSAFTINPANDIDTCPN